MVDQSPDLSLIFNALADPTRRRLLEALAAGEQCVTDLAAPFQLTLAAISKHLRVLERAGLLIRRKDGRVHHMRANPRTLDAARAWIEAYAAHWDHSFDALDAMLAKKTRELIDQADEQTRRLNRED
ncbi:MAG: metalloregulator ArsR/SmtB family transcription factor [Planctomycetota bacterium]